MQQSVEFRRGLAMALQIVRRKRQKLFDERRDGFGLVGAVARDIEEALTEAGGDPSTEEAIGL